MILLNLDKGRFGQRFAEKGYLSQRLSTALAEQEVQLITTCRKNRKPVPRTAFEKALRRRRCLIETAFGELKTLGQSEHTRPRSVGNFLANLMAGDVSDQ